MRKQPRQARAQATVEAILRATLQLLAQSGTVTTNHIAERAGVSVGTLYQYFADRRGILTALLEAELGGLLERSAVALAALEATAPDQRGPAIRAGVAAACAWRAAPATDALFAALGDADRYRGVQSSLDTLAEQLAPSLAAVAPAAADPVSLRACLGAVAAGLSCAAAHGWLACGERRARVIDELSLQLLGGLSFPRARWRTATGADPATLERGRPRLLRSPIGVQPIRHWTRTVPRQSRARANVAALIEATGELLRIEVPVSLEALATRTGLSLGTVYRYFAKERFALAAFGSQQLARLTAQVVERSPEIYTKAPAAAIQGLVRLGLEPLRAPTIRRLRLLALEHDEARIVDQQVNALHAALWPIVMRHPLCGIDADGFLLALHAVEGAFTSFQWADGLPDHPGGFAAILETTAILVFTTCATPRAAAAEVLAGTRPLTALHPEPDLPARHPAAADVPPR